MIIITIIVITVNLSPVTLQGSKRLPTSGTVGRARNQSGSAHNQSSGHTNNKRGALVILVGTSN